MRTGLGRPVGRHRALASPIDIYQRVQLLQGERLGGRNKQPVSGIDRELGTKRRAYPKLFVIDQHAIHVFGGNFCTSK